MHDFGSEISSLFVQLTDELAVQYFLHKLRGWLSLTSKLLSFFRLSPTQLLFIFFFFFRLQRALRTRSRKNLTSESRMLELETMRWVLMSVVTTCLIIRNVSNNFTGLNFFYTCISEKKHFLLLGYDFLTEAKRTQNVLFIWWSTMVSFKFLKIYFKSDGISETLVSYWIW